MPLTSVYFHWSPSSPCISFVISFAFFSLNVCGFCCWMFAVCVFFYRCSHFSCAVSYWFRIIIDVRFTVFFCCCCCCLRGTSVKPMVKPNKLQQLFMLLVSFSSIASNICNLITIMIAPMAKWTQQSRRHNKNQTNIMKQNRTFSLVFSTQIITSIFFRHVCGSNGNLETIYQFINPDKKKSYLLYDHFIKNWRQKKIGRINEWISKRFKSF